MTTARVSRQLAMVAVAVERRPPMCRTLEPNGPDEDKEENGAGAERKPAPGSEPSARWWYLRGSASWGMGLRVVFGVLDTVAVLTHDEALALVARALGAVGDLIVDAGQHRRS
ncbi:hypothetical protein ACQEU8_05700 [Streptomyces sp. CA-250714]|uniref:hypothetical protein n=1 Tax=Streptomyces sp. CA-250714 TaxID=3240060 RepID=UPI003D8CD605